MPVDESTSGAWRLMGLFRKPRQLGPPNGATSRDVHPRATKAGTPAPAQRAPCCSIEPTSVWTNAAAVRLPDTMPLQLQVFIVGVVAIQWRRAQASSA